MIGGQFVFSFLVFSIFSILLHISMRYETAQYK